MLPGNVPNVITDLDVSLLAHVLSDHSNATFGESDLLNAILHSNCCDQVSDLTSLLQVLFTWNLMKHF